jgi:quinol-cytochrome oxidoreductase complex cytochrome b subunit
MLEYIPVIGSGLRQLILGGEEPGTKTLMNFYAIHTALLPLLLLFMVPFHFWRIRLAKGLVVPRSPTESLPVEDRMLPAMPHLVTRDVSLALLVFAVVLLCAMFFDAPLAAQANPGLSPNPTKAPWYFMGIQELLIHFHPLFVLIVLPAFLTAGLLLVPYLKEDANTTGIWFGSFRGRKMTLISAMFGGLLTMGAIILDEYVFNTGQTGPSSLVLNGVLPFGVLVLIAGIFSMMLKRAFSANRNELIQSLFTLVITMFIVLTLVGTWLRGPGMKLVWVFG